MKRRERKKRDTVRDGRGENMKDKGKKKKCATERGDLREARKIRNDSRMCKFYRKN